MKPKAIALLLSRCHFEEIVEHAQQGAPNEACGLLAGKGEGVEIEERGWEVVGVYHSHTHTPAYPSPTDIAQAYFPETAYLILSLADPDRPVLRGFRIVEGEVEELMLGIGEDEVVLANRPRV